MNLFKAHRWALVATAVLAGPGLLEAQALRCNMLSPSCTGVIPPGTPGPLTCPPLGTCGASAPVTHAVSGPCGAANAGGFNLIGTQYENTCAGAMVPAGCTIGQPPLRFWQYDAYAKANNGCQPQNTNQAWWMINAFLDDATSPAPGHWYLYQANWQGTAIDGCYNASGAATFRTVAEISDVNLPAEGTPGHGAWYLVSSVNLASSQFNFDRVMGTTGGCNAHEVVQAPVPSVTIATRTQACTGTTTQTTVNTFDAMPGMGFFDVTVNISAAAHWFSELGMDQAPALISGYQIMYKTGAEPTTSHVTTGGWLPVYDPTDVAAPKNALGVVPVTTTSQLVALPVTTTTTNYWFALRIVYADASENPTTAFDPATGTAGAPVGPQITTPVGGHCGPVNFVPGSMAVEFESVTAERTPQGGVNVHWTTLSEDDTHAFKVFRSTDAAGTEAVTEAASWVDSHGANLEYTITDLSAGTGTYYYYVQEINSNGFGDRSEAVRVDPAGVAGTQSGGRGGRSRGTRR